jgi:hypothetical protein
MNNMKPIVKRIGAIEREPENTDVPHMDVKLERSSDGVYVLVFTGTNEDGDRYCARVIPSAVDVFLAPDHDKEGR